MTPGVPNPTGANRGNRVKFSVLSVSSCSNPAVLGTVGPEDTTDISTLKPEISREDKRGGVVEIDFNLSNSEGINIYSRRAGDTDFKFLARDTSPTYVDNRALLGPTKPEIREYRQTGPVWSVSMKTVSSSRTIGLAIVIWNE